MWFTVPKVFETFYFVTCKHISTCFLSNCTLTCRQLTIRNISFFIASIWQAIVDIHTSAHRYGDHYFDNYESSCIHEQGQPAKGHIDDVTSRVRVPGPHAVDHRVHHHDLAVVLHDLVLRHHQHVRHPARSYPLLVRASVLP